MQLTAYSIAELWAKGLREFYLYEVTKSNRVLRHPIRDLIEFDECVVVAIGDNDSFPKQRLIYSQGSGTRRVMGESVFYVDFLAVKSKFSAKNELKDLEAEIKELQAHHNKISDCLSSCKKKRDRLKIGMSDETLQKLEEEDKILKESLTQYLKENIYHQADRYGTDPVFTFLIDRIDAHKLFPVLKNELIALHKETPNEQLNAILTSGIPQQ